MTLISNLISKRIEDRYKEALKKLLGSKRFHKSPDPDKRHGPVKVYTKEEISSFKMKHCGGQHGLRTQQDMEE